MGHYNFCGVCNSITEHEYKKQFGVRWELCLSPHYDMIYNIQRISEYIEGRQN
jgi:hypothetical protein